VPSDDVPTVRPSGSLALFEQTLVEAIEKLDGLPKSDECADLRREAVATQALFRSWKVRTPEPKARAAAISRLMGLYRAVEELAARSRVSRDPA
jgi:hypothetical protein